MTSVAEELNNTSFEGGTVAWLIEKLREFPADAKVETEFMINDGSFTSVLGGLDDIFETSEHTVVIQSIV